LRLRRPLLSFALGVVTVLVVRLLVPGRGPTGAADPLPVDPPASASPPATTERASLAVAPVLAVSATSAGPPPRPPRRRSLSDDDFDSAGAILQAHDERAWQAVAEGLTAALHRVTGSCGYDFAQRLGHGWPFVARVAVDLAIGSQGLTVAAVSFAGDDPDEVGDPAFQQCFSHEASAVVLPCDRCRPGQLTVPWGLARFYAFPPPDAL
jgi:hypothetical protein